jgi:hypothetical protein
MINYLKDNFDAVKARIITFTSIVTVVVALSLSVYNQYFKVDVTSIERSVIDDSNNLFGVQRARIAIEEYKKGVHNDLPNCNCGTEVEKYSNGTKLPWGGYFISWITREAGSPFAYKRSLTSEWHIDNSRTIAYYLSENGTFYFYDDILENGATPQVGDILILGYMQKKTTVIVDPGAAMIIVEVLPNGNVDAIVGNLYGKVDIVTDFNYRENASVVGFGRPEIENGLNTNGMEW